MADHEVDIYQAADGKWYWSCASCEKAGEPTEDRDKAEENAKKHGGAK